MEFTAARSVPRCSTTHSNASHNSVRQRSIFALWARSLQLCSSQGEERDWSKINRSIEFQFCKDRKVLEMCCTAMHRQLTLLHCTLKNSWHSQCGTFITTIKQWVPKEHGLVQTERLINIQLLIHRWYYGPKCVPPKSIHWSFKLQNFRMCPYWKVFKEMIKMTIILRRGNLGSRWGYMHTWGQVRRWLSASQGERTQKKLSQLTPWSWISSLARNLALDF